MKTSKYKKMYLPALSILAVVVLLLVFISISTYRNLDRDQRKAIAALYSHGASLIQILETVVGIYSNDANGNFELEKLFRQTADSDPISYIYLLNDTGDIVFHTAGELANRTDIWQIQIESPQEIKTRIQKVREKERIYELAKVFSRDAGASSNGVVLGLKMTEYDTAYQTDMHHAVIMGGIVVVLGAGAIFFLFVIQNFYLVDKTLKETQEKVRHSEKLAAIGKLAAGVAHEIRNPLSSIKGFAQFLMHALKDRPEEKEYAAVMVREIDRINRVVTDLITFARPLSLERTQVNLGELLSHAVRLVEQDAVAKQVAIQQQVAPGLNDLWMDDNQIIQVLLNLLLNSLQATSSKGTILIGSEHIEAENRLHLWVEDDGIGISDEDQKKILDPFFTTRNKGTGLGLAIVHKIVENHQGNMTVHSPPPGKERGTRVSIYFPWQSFQKKDAP